MAFRRLVTVALLLTLVMSINSAPADQTETGRVSLRKNDGFPCNSGECACLPRHISSNSFLCQSITDSKHHCVADKCITGDEW
nr:TPA_inf: conotoxin precursor Cerm11 [Conus judaeus]